MREIWTTVQDYDNYEVSSLGHVRNKKSMRILKLQESSNGYLHIILYKCGKQKSFQVHRLVACAFLENPDNLPEVNHKDENKKNNCVTNLEFCDRKYNQNYGTVNARRAKKLSKPVLCVETCEVFSSTMDAERKKGFCSANIRHACKGRLKTVSGYHWQYV